MTTELQQALQTIQRINNTFAYEIWVPSLSRNVMFKEINTAQQKRLLKSIIDSEVHNTEFISTIYNIIKENCDDTEVDIDSLSIIDKLFICLKMRSVSISNEIDLEFVSKHDEDVQFKAKIDLEKIIKTGIKKIKHESEVIIKDHGFDITCRVPSILTEFTLENELRKNNQDLEIDNVEELRESIGDKFIGEVSKYIAKIQPSDSEDVIDITTFSFKDRIELIESLPSKCLSSVIEYMNQVNKDIDSVTIYKHTFKHADGKKEVFEHTLSIDSNFFIVS
jgi:hypothetical protein